MSHSNEQYDNQAPSLIIDSYEDVSTETTNLIINPQAFYQMSQFAEMMAKSKSMVPEHMRGNIGDCLAVCMQALQWGMNPFAVAQKTFNIKGVIGYEAQLVNAVITSRAPTTGRLQFEWFGDWEKILGKFVDKPSKFDDKNGNKTTYKAPNWNTKDEEGLGVKVWATLRGEDNPRELTLLMSQALTRNSTLWTEDPKQQIAYLAIKRWARLHCPDVILGVYTPDELADRGNSEPRNVTPKTANAGAESLMQRVSSAKQATASAPVIKYYDTSDLMTAISNMQTLEDTQSVVADIQKAKDSQSPVLADADLKTMQIAWTAKKKSIITGNEYSNIMKQINDCTDLDVAEKLKNVIDDKAADFGDQAQALYDKLEIVSEEIGAQG
ncbi:RecT family recombinase [Psychrobacter sp. BF1]|uniref:RecT family recombinase n=1 Tax=Psychrobacter sp. BF1 TaxID=2821147 RepID=UPI001C4E000B|nr:RecT family recombinase [Psychrobacter sp. BF1]